MFSSFIYIIRTQNFNVNYCAYINIDKFIDMLNKIHYFLTLNTLSGTSNTSTIPSTIAKAALRFIHPYSVICIDSGTTAHTVSRFLPDHIPLSVITSNLMTAVELSNKENIQTYLTGGMLYHRTKSIMTDSRETLVQHHADVAFISARAFRIPGGAFEHSYPLVETKRALVSIAKKVVLLIDHTKCEHVSLCNSIPLNQIDVIITDNKTSPEVLAKAAALKKEVVVVDPEATE